MPPEFNTHFGQFFRLFTEQLATILPPDTNLPAAFDNGTDDQQAFVQNLALFYTGYFRVRPPTIAACVPHIAACVVCPAVWAAIGSSDAWLLEWLRAGLHVRSVFPLLLCLCRCVPGCLAACSATWHTWRASPPSTS